MAFAVLCNGYGGESMEQGAGYTYAAWKGLGDVRVPARQPLQGLSFFLIGKPQRTNILLSNTVLWLFPILCFGKGP